MAGVRARITIALLAAPCTLVQAEQLEEIVVTAQKRSENIQNVGVTVSALSADQLRDANITETSQLAARIPGLSIQQLGGGATTVFNIRGVSQNDFGDQEEGPVAVYQDGAYNSFLGAVGGSLFDIDHVEVLKGPQGTLFGRNATGGLIQIISAQPKDVFEAYGEVTGGSFNKRKFEGAVGGPLLPGLDGRLSLSTEKADGYYHNDLPNAAARDPFNVDNISWRAQLLYKPTDTSSYRLVARGNNDSTFGGVYSVQPAAFDKTGTLYNGLSYHPTAAQFADFCNSVLGSYAGPGYADCYGATPISKDPWTGEWNTPGYFNRNYYGITATAEWRIAATTLTAVSDYQRLRKRYLEDTDGTSLDFFNFFQSQYSTQLSQELRAATQGDRYRATAGLYFLRIHGDFITGINWVGFGANFSNPFTQTTTSYAGFAQTEFDLATDWTLITGARWTHNKASINYTGTCIDETATVAPLNCAGLGIGPGGTSLQQLGFAGSQTNGQYAGKVELNWRLRTDWLLYAGVTRGNKGGGFNAPALAIGLTPGQVPFKPEDLTSYEAGLKTTLFGGSTRFNSAVFYYQYKNYQAFDLVNGSQLVFNARAATYGAEFELTTRPAPTWEISAGLSLLHATVFGITLPNGVVSDQVMPLSPKVSATTAIRKSWPLFGGTLSAQADSNFLSARQFNTINNPDTWDSSHVLENASLDYAASQHWGIRVFVKNISNQAQRVYMGDDAAVNGVNLSVFAPPRTFGGSVRYTW